MKFKMTTLLFLLPLILSSQKEYDKQWILGQSSDILIEFLDTGLNVLERENSNPLLACNTSICNSNTGIVDVYSNGKNIYNSEYQLIENGASINPGFVEDSYQNSPIPQGAMFLPMPKNSSIYYLFNLDLQEVSYGEWSTLDPQNVLYHVIDMEKNNGLGEVVKKNKYAISDTIALARGQLTAVKHANGRDWWIISPKAVSNCYYLVLLTPEGLQEPKLECEGTIWSDSHGIGQAVFSPDGSIYTRINPWNGLHIFDFDRCEGKLTSRTVMYPNEFPQDTMTAAGVAISSNSRFLYTSNATSLHQLDLQAEDIKTSLITIDTLNGNNFPQNGAIFYLPQLAPDGKIYIAGISSHSYLHVINAPNEKGLACDFVEQGVFLPELNFVGIPNHPNYRLGALESSSCDTLSVTVNEINEIQNIRVYPNPASENLQVSIENDNITSINSYTMTGQHLATYSVESNLTTLDVSAYTSGIYLLEVQTQSGQRYWRKIMIQ